MAAFRVGIIGCGRPWRSEGATGFGMSHFHAQGYEESPDAEIVALADISEENARAFQELHGGDKTYTDYHAMLANAKLDMVSICTWPHLHADMVIAAAEAGVKAIHCEKPMAPTFGEAKQMVEACQQHGVQLTFNHQRRFGAPFRKAKELLRSGAIGTLARLEATCPDLFDWGTHWFDMMFFYNDETPVEWVMGQVEVRGGRTVFGIQLEGQGLSFFRYQNGVEGLLVTGSRETWQAVNRLIGTDGTVELTLGENQGLRVWGKGQSEWQNVPDVFENNNDLTGSVPRGVLDAIDALKTGREPELSGQRALRATELIFATYESSRRRARVDLPLDISDSPLQTMIAAADQG